MKNGFAVFFAVFVALGLSWIGFVVTPAMQLGTAKQTAVLVTSDAWPQQRMGAATLGLQVYRANGCAACHTEQVRQEGVAFEVVPTKPGKDPAAFTNLISTLTLTNLNKDEADAVVDQINTVGGKSETHLSATGSDIARGWGIRKSVAADYLYDVPVQLGTLRLGPDLANIGVRAPDLNWQLVHLYVPRALVKDSAMPSFKFLFEVRKIGATPSPDALNLPADFAPAAGYEVVPTAKASELADYLLSLRANVPLYEAPFSAATTKP